MSERICEDCPKSLADRHRFAKLCLDCSRQRQIKASKESYRKKKAKKEASCSYS